MIYPATYNFTGARAIPVGATFSQTFSRIQIKGSSSGATTDAAGYDIGDTAITLAAVGTGALNDEEVITFANDLNEYTLATGLTDVSEGGVITLDAPGLVEAIAAETTAITIIPQSLDLTGATVECQFRTKENRSSSLLASCTVVLSNGAESYESRITISLTAAQTVTAAAIATNGFYDLVVTDSGGTVTYYLEGAIEFDGSVTVPA